MRLVYVSFILLLAAASSALASTIPAAIDPHIIFATGGDATDIGTNGVQLTLSQQGGGIFVFHNATGSDLAILDLTLPVLTPFKLDVTTVPAGSLSGFDFTFPVDCPPEPFANPQCVKIEFKLTPGGPLGAIGQNFVLDFDFPLTAVDQQVLSGNYQGGDQGGTGDWIPGIVAEVTPVPTTPEPGNFAALLVGGVGLVLYYRRRKRSAR